MKTRVLAAAVSACLCIPVLSAAADTPAKYFVENLGRGVIAIRTSENAVYVGWRLLGTDPSDLHSTYIEPRTGRTGTAQRPAAHRRRIRGRRRTCRRQIRIPCGRCSKTPNSPQVRHSCSRRTHRCNRTSRCLCTGQPAATSKSPGIPTQAFTYSPNDASVADLDGDGEYEIVLKWDPSNARDNSLRPRRPATLDAYELDGTHLWRIDLGRNIRAGAHYTQFMVYDLDGDGEPKWPARLPTARSMALAVIGDANKDYRSLMVPTDGIQVPATNDPRYGKVLAGPEYFTIFEGLRERPATTNYIAGRDPLDGWGGIGGNGNNDNNGNRGDRMLAAVAYLDGRLPSVIMARGYYGRSVLAAWDWAGNGQLTSRWVFDSGLSVGTGSPGRARRHSPARAITTCRWPTSMPTARTKSSTARWSWTTTAPGCSRRACDTAMRCTSATRAVASRPRSVRRPRERRQHAVAGHSGHGALRRATGQIIWSIVPASTWAAAWQPTSTRALPATNSGARPVGLVDGQGKRIADAPSSVNHAVWWDADLCARSKTATGSASGTGTPRADRLLTANGAASNNGTKANAALTGDLLGDWREEVIWRAADNLAADLLDDDSGDQPPVHADARSAVPAGDRLAERRLQPAAPSSFFIGDGMAAPPPPNIVHRDTQAPAFSKLAPSLRSLPPVGILLPVFIKAELVDLLDEARRRRASSM